MKRDKSGRFTSTKKQNIVINPKREVTHLYLLCDISGSMQPHEAKMRELLTKNIEQYKNIENMDVFVSLFTFSGSDTYYATGRDRAVLHELVSNLDINKNNITINRFECLGQTPLVESIVRLKDIISEKNHKEPILIIGYTDGEENSSNKAYLRREYEIAGFAKLPSVTMAFSCPAANVKFVENLGIDPENITPWTQDDKGFKEMTAKASNAAVKYTSDRSRGLLKSTALYADTNHLNAKVLNSVLEDHTRDYEVYTVKNRLSIEEFVRQIVKKNYDRTEGRAFYELTKPETVQHHKRIVLKDKTGKIYEGALARKLLGLADTSYGEVRLKPGQGEYQIFINSTSSNRILLPGTTLLYRK